MSKPKIELFGDLTGQTQIGFRRGDLPLVHTIHRAPAGEQFQIHEHFATCTVCKAHGVTLDDFKAWYVAQSMVIPS